LDEAEARRRKREVGEEEEAYVRSRKREVEEKGGVRRRKREIEEAEVARVDQWMGLEVERQRKEAQEQEKWEGWGVRMREEGRRGVQSIGEIEASLKEGLEKMRRMLDAM
jgi:hypothetical protein